MSLRPLLASAAVMVALCLPVQAAPLVSPMQAAIAAAASSDDQVAAFYRGRDFAPIWMGEGAAGRRAAFLWALDQADDHGLPTGRYDPATIRAQFAAAADGPRRGALEVAMTLRFLRYAKDVSSGILVPSDVDPLIRQQVPELDRLRLISAFADGDPYSLVKSLWPTSPAYLRLLRERLRLERTMLAGGWGPEVPDGKLRRGDAGRGVVALRDRLIRMGYLGRSAVVGFDGALEAALREFQTDHGLDPDGEAGAATIRALNVPLESRMEQIVVGLERQRWLNVPLEPRHVLVNLAEQHAYVVDDGKVTFDTVVVVGADEPGRRTPEFSDTMTHMVVNPTWNVPRSITVKEYLPALRRGGARHLQLYSRNGPVDPRNVDFSRYNASNFPFSLKQAPGPRNALGRVKFMFPNPMNIYLHDTPSRDLFARDARLFSHGCIRVARPLELAYHLLAPQTATPEGDFTRILDTGKERRVDLETPIGVHLVYWSAWVTPTGHANYRGDPYGRDAEVLRALREAGVALDPSRS